jgi:hypothetical protein
MKTNAFHIAIERAETKKVCKPDIFNNMLNDKSTVFFNKYQQFSYAFYYYFTLSYCKMYLFNFVLILL